MKWFVTLFGFLVVQPSFDVVAADRSPQLEFTLFFTGYVRGNFEPCGCKAGPYGGLARRAGYLSDHRKKTEGHSIQVDAGNYFQMIGPDSNLINKLMLDSLDSFPVRVFNLGTEDLMFWRKLSQAALAKTQVISTNLAVRDSSQGAPKPYALVQVPAGQEKPPTPLTVGFLGLADPTRVKPRSGFRGRDPLEAMAEVLPEVSRKADLIVVLADLPRALATEITRKHSEVAVVVVAERRSRVQEPERVNNAVIVSSVDRGRYLGQLLLSLDRKGQIVAWDSEYVALNQGMTEDPVWLQRQEAVARRLYGSPNAVN